MTDEPRNITIETKIISKIGPVPEDLTSFAQITTFGLANLKRHLLDKGVSVQLDAQQSIFSYREDGVLVSFNSGGVRLDDRHFRIQPDDAHGHALEVSSDGGKTFDVLGSFVSHGAADGIGRAWLSGRIETTA